MTDQTKSHAVTDSTDDHLQPKWRQDFPIDWARDHFISRREFTKFLVLISGSFAVGQLWIGAKNLIREHRGAPPIKRLCRIDDVPIGGAKLISYPGEYDTALLIRKNKDTFVSYGNKCTHLQCAVIPRVADNELFCPCHEGHFSLEDGRPLAGPPQRPLPRIKLKLSGGYVYATGVELAAR